jgi:hypothetical protein
MNPAPPKKHLFLLVFDYKFITHYKSLLKLAVIKKGGAG